MFSCRVAVIGCDLRAPITPEKQDGVALRYAGSLWSLRGLSYKSRRRLDKPDGLGVGLFPGYVFFDFDLCR